MSIESDLKRLADAAEGILAYLTGTPVQKRGPGRPTKDTSVSPAPEDAQSGEAPAAAGAQTALTPAPAAMKDAPAASAAAEIPDTALIAVVKKFIPLGKKDLIVSIVAKHGGSGNSSVSIPQANRAAFLAEAEAALPKAA